MCRQAGLHISQGGCLTTRTQGVTVYTLLVPCVSPYSISFHVSHFYELGRAPPASSADTAHSERKKKGLRRIAQPERKKATPGIRPGSAIKSAEFKNLPGGYCIETWKIYSLRKKGTSHCFCFVAAQRMRVTAGRASVNHTNQKAHSKNGDVTLIFIFQISSTHDFF